MPKNEYHIDMGIRFKPDDASVKELDKLFDNYKEINVFGDEKQFEQMRKLFSDFEERKNSILEANKMLAKYRSVVGQGDNYTDATTRSLEKYMDELADGNKELEQLFDKEDESRHVFIGNMKTIFTVKLVSLAQSFLQSLANVFKEAWKEMGDMVDQSFLTNSTTRSNAFTYGFSAAESYGFEQAKAMLGINSEEDLWYMNDYQKSKFQEIMTKYAERYQKLYDSGFFEQYLDFQIEMQEFQQDMKMEIIEFFMDNKDTIKTFMELGIDAMEFVIESLGTIVKLLDTDGTSDQERLDNIESIISSYQNDNRVTNNVNVNTNANFSGTTDSQKDYYMNMMNAASMEAKRYFGG